MEILIGTKNSFKAGEMIWLLDGIQEVVIHRLDEMSEVPIVEEDQVTLLKNADKKAKEISKYTDWYVLTSDGGVDIPGLGDKWDILRNQRIVGEDKTDLEKTSHLFALMKGLRGEQRKCQFHFALSLAKNGEILWSKEDLTDKGYVAEKLFDKDIPLHKWMGHLWLYPQFNRVFNQLTEEEKEEVRKQMDPIKKELHQIIQTLGG